MTKTLNRQAIHCKNNPFFYFRPTQSSFPSRFIMKTSQEAKRSIPFRLASSSASQFCITELGGATSHTSGPVPEPIVSAVIAPQSPYRRVSEETEQSDSFFFFTRKRKEIISAGRIQIFFLVQKTKTMAGRVAFLPSELTEKRRRPKG